MTNSSFGSRRDLAVGDGSVAIYGLDAAGADLGSLPYSLKVLLENLLRNEDGGFVKKADVEAMASWNVKATVDKEIAFRTARVTRVSARCAISSATSVSRYVR